ncbi:MAG: autotransporter domain-containing protein [Verrucomicrobiales bacterium]
MTGFQIDDALTSLGPSRTLVFSPAIVEALSAKSLPAPTAQQIGSFQGLTAATRDIGGRLAALRTGRYLTSSRNARANEFSGSKNPKSEITMLDDGRWFEILVQGDAMDLDLDNFGAADTRSEIDSYSESGAGLFNIAVNDQESDSLSSDLGWQVAVPIETATGYFAPHVRVG